MQLYINEWPQIEALVTNNNDAKMLLLNTNKLHLFIINKILKYNMIENFGNDLSDKIQYLKSENIISMEIIELFNESDSIIKNEKYNQINRLLFLRKEILEWFLREYKNHENIHNIYGEKVFKNYKNNNLHYYKKTKKDKNKDRKIKKSIENKNRKNINQNLTISNNKVKNQELVILNKQEQELVVFDKYNNNYNKTYKNRIRNTIKNLFKNIIKFNSKKEGN